MPTIAGPRSASAFATDSGGAPAGATDWSNINDVADPDAGYATSDMSDNGFGTGASYFLMLTDFGFDIPADATITGIFVVWRAAQNADVDIASTQLLKAGVADGTDYGSTVGGALTGIANAYGGLKDLWGTTWTPAEVNASDFGVRLAFSTATPPQTVEVDHAYLFVRYLTFSERVYTVDCACCGGGPVCDDCTDCHCYFNYGSPIFVTATRISGVSCDDAILASPVSVPLGLFSSDACSKFWANPDFPLFTTIPGDPYNLASYPGVDADGRTLNTQYAGTFSATDACSTTHCSHSCMTGSVTVRLHDAVTDEFLGSINIGYSGTGGINGDCPLPSHPSDGDVFFSANIQAFCSSINASVVLSG